MKAIRFQYCRDNKLFIEFCPKMVVAALPQLILIVEYELMKQYIVDGMLIKKCSLSDVEKLAQLNKRLIEDEKSDNTMNIEELKARMQGFLESDYAAYFFMENDGITGYALVRHSSNPLYLRQFYIDRNFRRQGKGRAALKLLLEELKTDKVDIEVLSWNEPAVKFWESCGFVERSRYMRMDAKKSATAPQTCSEASSGAGVSNSRYE